DFHVTGVQTCALPIYVEDSLAEEETEESLSGSLITYRGSAHKETAEFLGELLSFPVAKDSSSQTGSGNILLFLGKGFSYEPFQRSEERRVGKECRLWW